MITYSKYREEGLYMSRRKDFEILGVTLKTNELFVNFGVGVEEGPQHFQADDRCNRLDEPGGE